MLGSALATTTVGVLPAYFVGGLAAQLRAELGFGEAALGAAVAIFFATSSLGSAPAGRIVERVGVRAAGIACLLTSGAAMLGVAGVARSWGMLVALLAVAGVANAALQVAVNLQLARGAPPGRRGLAFGLKLAAIPTSTLLAGAAVPLVAVTIGWRWAFAMTAVLALGAAFAIPRDAPRGRRLPPAADTPLRAGDAPMRPLVLLAAAGGLGTASANCLGAFLVDSSVAGGLSPSAAGWLLVGGSVTGIAVRLAGGTLADRRGVRVLPWVAAMLAAGAGGLALLAGATPALLLTGTVIAFGLGWGWNGLYNLAVVRHNEHAPAAASGITQTGVYSGGVVGPLAFGAVAQAGSYGLAWLGAAAVMLLAGAAMLASDRLLRRWALRPSQPHSDRPNTSGPSR